MMISALYSHQDLFFLITGIRIFSLPSPGIWHFCIFVWIFPLVEGSSYLMFSNTCPFLSNKVHCKMALRRVTSVWSSIGTANKSGHFEFWSILDIFANFCHEETKSIFETVIALPSLLSGLCLHRCFHCCAKTLTKSNLGRTGVISVHGSQVTLHH